MYSWLRMGNSELDPTRQMLSRLELTDKLMRNGFYVASVAFLGLGITRMALADDYRAALVERVNYLNAQQPEIAQMRDVVESFDDSVQKDPQVASALKNVKTEQLLSRVDR